jgi:transcriptional regulator with XRE-family HTH domain
MKDQSSFMAAVQREGWQIKAADGEKVYAACPREGCGLILALKSGQRIPPACSGQSALAEFVVDQWNDGRLFLRERRQSLHLSITDVEDISGIARDHMAKFEKDNPSKIPNVEAFLLQAQALGYDVVLRPSELPRKALAIIAETRYRVKTRAAMQVHLRQKRASRKLEQE